MQSGNPRSGVTSIADIAFATLNNGKKYLKIYKFFTLNNEIQRSLIDLSI